MAGSTPHLLLHGQHLAGLQRGRQALHLRRHQIHRLLQQRCSPKQHLQNAAVC